MIEEFKNYTYTKEKIKSYDERIKDLDAERKTYLKAMEYKSEPTSKILNDPTPRLALEHIKKEEEIKTLRKLISRKQKELKVLEDFIESLEDKDAELVRCVFCEEGSFTQKKASYALKCKITVPTVNRWIREIFKEVE